ncbi:hypothetical protein AMTR_s00745p00008930, partial [Amborella trichopoda]
VYDGRGLVVITGLLRFKVQRSGSRFRGLVQVQRLSRGNRVTEVCGLVEVTGLQMVQVQRLSRGNRVTEVCGLVEVTGLQKLLRF